MTTDPRLSLRNVRKGYGDARDGISLDVAAREFLVIVGPSGCGMSP
jgi:ABC-type sugar transport system ATPase subunit